MPYSMIEQLAVGEQYEKVLDAHFKQWYQIDHASYSQQRDGIDRYFTSPSLVKTAVEYKSDLKAHSTGNVFLETWSVNERSVTGWVWSSAAQVLVYFIPQDGTIYFYSFDKLREVVSIWQEQYPTAQCRNEEWTSTGLLVPAEAFAQHAFNIQHLNLE